MPCVFRTGPFEFKGHTLRTVEIEGEPWVPAADVLRILGMPFGGVHGSTARYLRSLRGDERRTATRQEAICAPLFVRMNAPALTLINESGLYKLILRSDKPEAREFQDWVTREVLPSIRKTGTPKNPPKTARRTPIGPGGGQRFPGAGIGAPESETAGFPARLGPSRAPPGTSAAPGASIRQSCVLSTLPDSPSGFLLDLPEFLPPPLQGRIHSVRRL